MKGDKYHFGDYELDTARHQLRRAGEPVHVEPRALDLLRHLVEHRDRVVPKNELLDEVWGDRFVSEAALTTALRTARLAVDDTGSRQQVIRGPARTRPGNRRLRDEPIAVRAYGADHLLSCVAVTDGDTGRVQRGGECVLADRLSVSHPFAQLRFGHDAAAVLDQVAQKIQSLGLDVDPLSLMAEATAVRVQRVLPEPVNRAVHTETLQRP